MKETESRERDGGGRDDEQVLIFFIHAYSLSNGLFFFYPPLQK